MDAFRSLANSEPEANLILIQRAALLRVLLPRERRARWSWIEEHSVGSLGQPSRFCCSDVVEAVVPEDAAAA